jgi:hypothetical protein
MGDVADDMVSGACCSRCGCYFEKEHGHPVYCLACWGKTPKEGRRGYSVAIIPEVGAESGEEKEDDGFDAEDLDSDLDKD